MTKKERFEKILRQVEVKFNRGSANEWKNRDFEKLSLGILLKTKTNISVLTLKRIFGKISTPDDYFPQKATIEALEVYAGQFVLLNDIEAGAKAEPSKLTKSTNKKAFVFLIAGGALVLSVFILIIINAEPEIERKPSIQLTYTDGFNPKTVHFEYTTPNNTDSFSILFDDAYPPIYVQNGEKQTLSYYFQNPGLFRVRMMKNYSTISSTINVFVGTNSWQSLGYYFDQKFSERMYSIDLKNCIKNEYFHATKRHLSAASMDTSRIVVLRFDNYKETKVNGDNFTLNSTLKNPEKWAAIHCNSIFLYVEGTESSIRFRFANSGCSHWIEYQLSEKHTNARNTNLSNFAIDINNWQNFRIENRNKKVSVMINDEKRFEGLYTNSIGDIVGVTVLFHGNGYIKNYSLVAQDKELFVFDAQSFN